MYATALCIVVILLCRTDAFAQFKPLKYIFEKDQHISVETRIEAGRIRHEQKLIRVDSIDERGGAHITIENVVQLSKQGKTAIRSRATDVNAEAIIKAIFTPRGEVRVRKILNIPDSIWRKRIATDSVLTTVWGEDAGMMSYQFLFPFLPRQDGIAAALDTVQTGRYARRAITDDGNGEGVVNDAVEDKAAYFVVKTTYHRDKPFTYKGEQFYRMYRIEEETEENCLTPAKPVTFVSTRKTEWLVRLKDGALLKEYLIWYKIGSDGTWQGILRNFDADNNNVKLQK